MRLADVWALVATVEARPVDVVRYADHVAQIPDTTLTGVFRLERGTGGAVITLTPDIVYLLLDAVLGAGGGARGDVPADRKFTIIEMELMQLVAGHVLAAFSAALAPAVAAVFAFEHWEREPHKLAPAVEGEGVIVLELALGWQERSGSLRIGLPASMLEPVRPQLGAVYPGEKFGQDALWRAHLAAEVSRAPLEIAAVLYEATVPLGRIRQLQPGDTFSFDLPGDAAVELRCGGERLSRGQMGRSGPLIAIQIETPFATAARGDRT
jgi:flagellar motor switch protein FliM